jgi:hypothetical protein
MTQAATTGDDHDRAEKLRTLAEGLAGTIRLSRVMAEARRPVDLTGLEGGIGLLCAQVLDLPPAQGPAMIPCLAAVLAEIASLETALIAANGPPPPPT